MTTPITDERRPRPFNDLREYISMVKGMGHLTLVEGADIDLEIGALTGIIGARRNCPVLLFDAIKGYPRGVRLLTNILNNSERQKIIYGCPSEIGETEAPRWWNTEVKKFRPVPPIVVNDGPVAENIKQEKDVDLLILPWARWHEKDGGGYMCATSTITRDPGSGYVNVGSYRFKLIDETTCVGHMASGHHGDIISKQYWKQGKPCPVAISLGQDPSLLIAAGDNAAWGHSEYDYAGWLRGAPVEVVKGVYTDLPIPATAEAVLEGEILPPKEGAAIEGPFGEMGGYYGDASRSPLIKIHAILYRDDPIIMGSPPFPNTARNLFGARGLRVRSELEALGIPGIKGVRYGGGIVVLSIEQSFPGHAMRAALGALGGTGGYHTRFVIIVDEDVNPHDLDEVFEAMGSRCDPGTSLDINRRIWSSRVDPRLEPEKIEKGDYTASCAIIDATRPFHWKEHFPEKVGISIELRNEIERKWKKLLQR
jgi:4-hydroxy-3-polyprenylbenzoate decarboxylase